MKKSYLLALIPLCLVFVGCKKKTTKTKTTSKDTTRVTTNLNTTTKLTTSKKTPDYEELLQDYYYEVKGDDVIILGVKEKEAQELVVPEGVTKIVDDDDYDGFRYLYNLEKVTLPKSLKEIEKGSFAGCNKLVEIYNLSDINLTLNDENDKTYITENAYAIHKSLSEESNIVRFNGYSFIHTDEVSKLFNYTGTDKFLTTPSSYNYIGEDITSYDIREKAFMYNEMVTLELSEAVNVIESYAFGDCYNLSSVIVGKNVTEIKSHAFGSDDRSDEAYTVGMYNECNRLVEVINKSDLNIEKGSRTNGRIAKNALVVKGENEDSSIVIKDNYVFLKTSDEAYLTCYIGNEETVITPDSFVFGNETIDSYIINDYALAYKDNIEKVIISNSATSIEQGIIFNDQFHRRNDTVEEIIIGNNVTFIQANAFAESYELKKLTLGSKVKNIKIGSFSYCSELTDVVILSEETLELDEKSFYKPNNSDYKPIERVFFKGTKETWDNWPSDKKGINNSQLFNATIYYYSAEKPTDDGNYWTMVNDEIIIWE
ncbi:MAG: leucine-rich repeat protein [Acholeplasmatales bacterium]|nr:leucine-rich repeat protein [Acholeplasmatales bacterium]